MRWKTPGRSARSGAAARGAGWRRRRSDSRRRCYSRPPADYEIADFGHVLHREPHALAPQAAIFHAAIGHVVHTVARHIVDHDPADVEMIRMDQIDEAYDRMESSDVKFRFVIDMESMPAAS